MRDQHTLLSSTKLTLSEELSQSRIGQGRLVLKHTPSGHYLTLHKTERVLLDYFKQPASVSEVLPQLINDRKCPPLREFYELILKARQAKLLTTTDENTEGTRDVIDWRIRIPWEKAQFLGVFCVLSGFFGLLLGQISPPPDILAIALGYLALLIAYNAGEIMAASVMKAEGLKIYTRTFRWRHPIPHIAFDLRDSNTAGGDITATVALARMAPLFLMAGISALWYQPAALILTLGVLLITAPTHNMSPGLQLLRGVQHYAPLDTQRNLIYTYNTNFWAKLYFSIHYADYRYLLVQTAFTAGWLLVLIFTLSAQLEINSLDFAYQLFIHHEPDITHPLVLVSLTTASLIAAFFILKKISKHKLSLIHKHGDHGRSLIPTEPEKHTSSKLELIRQNPLFNRLPNSILSELVEHTTIKEYQSGETITLPQDSPPSFAFIMEGYISLNNKEHRTQAILTHSDILGTQTLAHTSGTHTTKALTHTQLLIIQKSHYQQIKDLPTPQEITKYEQLRIKLHEIPLFTNLPAPTITKLLQTAKHSHPPKGQTILSNNKENQFFYIITEGSIEIKRKDKKIKTLNHQALFGHLSLLQGTYPSANVISATEHTNLLTIQRSNFLKLFCQHHKAALILEEYCSKQLRKPIFPLGSQKANTMEKNTRIISI